MPHMTRGLFDKPRFYSAIYKLTLGTMVKWVVYHLPEPFVTGSDARRFAEAFQPNKLFAFNMVPVEVCERGFIDKKLARRLRQAA